MATTKTPTNLDTLIINYLSQADFDAEVSGGTLDANQLYLTPDSSITEVVAGTGLQGGGTSGTVTLNHKNSTTAKTAQAVYPIAFDAQGHITSSGNAVTIPSAYTLPVATYNTLGGVKPWKSYTASATGPTAATASTAVSVNAITNTASRYYAVEMDKDGRMFVNVPWTNVNSSYITTDTNTTYTLTNALSSHKFTWTFTAGGSGSGYTTTTAELAAGTGISLTDDATNKKITIASTVVNTDEQLKIEEVFDSTTQTYIYYPILGRSTTTTGVRQIDTDGFQYYNRNGTTSAEGIAQLTLGNATASGVAGNKPGSINLFSSTTYAGLIKTGALTAARTYNFPNKSGTVALIEDLTNVVYLTDEGNLKIDGTVAADQGIFNKLIATTADIGTLDVDNLTAQNATVVGLLDVQGQLHSNSWTNSNIATIDGSFFITPTVSVSMGTFTYSSTANSGNGQITLSAGSGYSFAVDSNWTQNSLVMITGQVTGNNAMMPLGTIRGVLSSAAAGTIIVNGPFTDSVGNPCVTLQELGNVTGVNGKNLKVSIYQKYISNGLAPIGIYMTSGGYNSQNHSFIDIYNGGNTISTAPADTGAFAKPVVRIGNLANLSAINNTAPTGYGIYTTNGYFEGLIVSTKGQIGGFTLTTNAIYNGSLGTVNSVYTSTGTSASKSIGGSDNINGWAFAAGTAFGVTKTGDLYASSATISGKVNASSGSIGGWEIGNDTNHSLYYGTFNTENGIYISPNYSGILTGVSTETLNWTITAGQNFGITTEGKVFVKDLIIDQTITGAILKQTADQVDLYEKVLDVVAETTNDIDYETLSIHQYQNTTNIYVQTAIDLEQGKLSFKQIEANNSSAQNNSIEVGHINANMDGSFYIEKLKPTLTQIGALEWFEYKGGLALRRIN